MNAVVISFTRIPTFSWAAFQVEVAVSVVHIPYHRQDSLAVAPGHTPLGVVSSSLRSPHQPPSLHRFLITNITVDETPTTKNAAELILIQVVVFDQAPPSLPDSSKQLRIAF